MLFQFEQDFVDTLRCIPMVVRYKLDVCGVKLKLQHWHRFTYAQRLWLVQAPCDTAPEKARYREQLRAWVTELTGAPPADLPVPDPLPWESDGIPTAILRQLQTVGQAPFDEEQWRRLSPLQRFALLKLSQPGHENRNFLPALREFGLSQENCIHEHDAPP
ncbi:MAG: nitrate reductase associated protein [Gloeomargarita sp. SKYBB_i_bin120]|nr:nitrate reductase associated protein [Gloeomargarita sp. SKYB120]MDW8178550.1 nitrate reductase associated protein [Gloeomargarita sp. SKYBB_i_bin120]